MSQYSTNLTALFGVLNVVLVVVLIPWILMTKKEPTAALAWCLVVLLMPVLGAFLFWVFGVNYLRRKLERKQAHRARFRQAHPPPRREAARGRPGDEPLEAGWDGLGHLALKVDAFPAVPGNAVALYHDTRDFFDALLAAIRQAKEHVHVEYFIIHNDETGRRLLDVLAEKAKQGVEVRLLYDAMGSLRLGRAALRPLLAVGGKASAFLPLNPLRSRIQVNLRNHRKIVVLDGRIGFTGGMNIGDEYLGMNPYFGYWRDTCLRLDGPAAAGLQRIFAEDWHFTTHEPLEGDRYCPELEPAGDAVVQVAESGPDQEVNCIREIYFTAMLGARQRLWMASPYFVPDAGLMDALRLARYRDVDVRLLSLYRPDHYLSFYAGRYYWTELLDMGVKVYQYKKGMMHSKVLMVDGQWAMVGTANLDNRSLKLNFEVGCGLFAPPLVAELEAAFRRDLEESVRLEPTEYARRPLRGRLVENACRLLAPIL